MIEKFGNHRRDAYRLVRDVSSQVFVPAIPCF